MASTSRKLHRTMRSIDQQMFESGHGNSIVAVDSSDENAVIRFLLSERVYGYPKTDGSLGSNYKQFVFNNHPLLGIFLAPKNHPFTITKRIIVFLSSIAVAVTISYILWDTDFLPEIAECRSGCKPQTVTDANGNKIKQCTGGYNNGLDYDKYKSSCQYYHSWMLGALSGMIIVPYTSLLRFLGTCGCFQGRDFFKVYTIGVVCKRCWEAIGWSGMGFLAVLSIVSVLWAIIECYRNGTGFAIFKGFLLSKLWSFLEWFIWSGPYFAYRYPVDKRYFYAKLSQDDEEDDGLQLARVTSQRDAAEEESSLSITI